jgi:hypothetical protein
VLQKFQNGADSAAESEMCPVFYAISVCDKGALECKRVCGVPHWFLAAVPLPKFQ